MPAPEPGLRRVLLALDVSGASQAALSLAFTLAVRFEVELDALLLTRTELTRAAGLPFATELSLLAGVERNLSASLMDRSLRALFVRVEAMMADLAAPTRVRWTLTAAERIAWKSLLADPGEGSLLVLGHVAHHLATHQRVQPRRLCVLYDESAAGQVALSIALAIDPQSAQLQLPAGNDAATTASALPRLAARVALLRPQILVMPSSLYARHAGALRPVLQRLECTLLAVGEGAPRGCTQAVPQA